MHEKQLNHPEPSAAWCFLGKSKWRDLGGHRLEGVLTLVDRHNQRDLVDSLYLPNVALHNSGILAQGCAHPLRQTPNFGPNTFNGAIEGIGLVPILGQREKEC